MKRARMCAIVTLALALALTAVPAAAFANSFVIERGLLGGLWGSVQWAAPDVSGHWAVFLYSPNPGLFQLHKVDLRSGVRSVVATDATDGIESPAVDGDWVAYAVGGDIRVKNLATGTLKKVTNDGATTAESDPVISGHYVVWEVDDGVDIDLWGKDFTSSHAKFLVAGGTGNQMQPSISGKRVAYRDESGGDTHGQIMIKTIGSSSSAWNITSDAGNYWLPSIGDHLVAWLGDAGGHAALRTYNYETKTWVYGPSDPSWDVLDPQVAGDRVVYGMSDGVKLGLYLWDFRVQRASGSVVSFPFTDLAGDQESAKVAGNSCVYLSGGWPIWARFQVPSLSVGAVPRRIPHHGHIHLKGTLTEQGLPIAGAHLRVEKYSGGKWVLAKTLTTSASGAYAYKTPPLHAKTKYRVAYDGMFSMSVPGVAEHLSAVSAVRTGWPR